MLRGRVSTFYLKQLAQSFVAKIDEVERIINLLDVDVPTEDRCAPKNEWHFPTRKSIDGINVMLPARENQ